MDMTQPVTAGEQSRHARRHRLAWLAALPRLPRHVAATMPWVTLISGCLADLAYLAILAHVDHTAHSSLSQGTLRIAFLPAVAAVAFVVRAPFRPLTQATPVPAWVTSGGHLLLAAPVLAATCWAQLGLMAYTIPRQALSHQPAVYPLLAQLAGWCAVAVAVAACIDRSRYADLGGAIAGPVTFAAIALTWYLPVTAKILVSPPASAHGVTVAWYCVASAALVLTGAAMRDRWHRYARRPRLGH